MNISQFDGTQPCATTDPEAFFPDTQGTNVGAKAKRICFDCKYREPCLEYALTVNVEGIWGGTTHTERLRIRRTRGMGPAAPLMSTIDFPRPSPRADTAA